MAKTTNQSVEIDAKELTTSLGEMCMNLDFSDVTFVVGQCVLPAHKVILAARSPYFRAMCYGEMADSEQSEIELKNVPLVPFKAILGYIYTGSISFENLGLADIFETLDLANEYDFEALGIGILEHLTTILSLDNCCHIFDVAHFRESETLSDACMNFMDKNAIKLLTHDAFKTLKPDCLCLLLKRDSFFAPEIEIFNAVHEWYRNWPDADINEIISHVRFPLMDLEQIFNIVHPSSILDPNQVLEKIREKTLSTNIRYRIVRWPETNIATAEFGAKTIKGERPEALLNGNIGDENGFTYHSITASGNDYILVELGAITSINRIKILLFDNKYYTYSYYIEVSVDQSNWERIVDHTRDNCRAWQFLHFSSRDVRYIKLVGTAGGGNAFCASTLEAYYTFQEPIAID